MNILQVVNSANPGGMEQHVLDLVTGLVKAGHNLYVWCPQGPMSDFYKQAGADVTNRKIKWDLDPKYIKELSKFLIDHKIDVVHGHEVKAATNAILAGWFARTKVRVGHIHTPMSEWQVPAWKKPIILINILGYAGLINFFGTVEIALTNSRKSLKTRELILPSKLEVIANCIDTAKFELSELERSAMRVEIRNRYDIPLTAFVFGNLGRLSEEKGSIILLKAFAEFSKQSISDEKSAYLVFAGGGALEQQILSEAKNLGLQDQIIVTGIFAEEDKIKFYSAFDVFVFPTVAEGFGIVLQEALTFGLPVISSDLVVLKEVGSNFVTYFKTRSVHELSKAITAAFSKYSYRPYDRGAEARAYVSQTFSIQKFVNAYIDLYRKKGGEK